MTVAEDVGRIASTAAAFAEEGEKLVGVLAAETLGRLVYLCAFESAEGHSWLALGADAEPLTERRLVLEAASLAALCELLERQPTLGGRVAQPNDDLLAFGVRRALLELAAHSNRSL